jgi:hypothetical protein
MPAAGRRLHHDYFRVVRSTCRRLPCCSAVKIRFRRVERVGNLSVVDATSVWPFQCGGNSCSSRAANLSKIRNSYKGNHWRASARLRRFTKVAEVSTSCRQHASGGSAPRRAKNALNVPRAAPRAKA